MRILLTAIGSMSALCSIERLHKAGHFVAGCDIYPKEWHLESSVCDTFLQAPLARDENNYTAFILEFCKSIGIKFVIPLTDIEIDVLNRNRAQFRDAGITLCIPSEQTLSIARNKKLLYDYFKGDKSVPSILTVSCDALKDVGFPCVAKPYDGRSSEGLYILKKEDDLSLIGRENLHRYVFQPFTAGTICTVDYVRSAATGNSFCIPRKELLRTKNGAGVTVEVFHDNPLSELVNHIGDALDINGTINMEFILHDGKYYLIDINPRFSAGISFSCRRGYDFINAHLACHTGSDIPQSISYNDAIDKKIYVETIK